MLLCIQSNFYSTDTLPQFAFAGSNIISTNDMAREMMGAHSARYPTWALCYSGTVHGWSGVTMHANCAGRCECFITYIIFAIFGV